MGLEKVAFNFMVKRGGKLAKSLLLYKPNKKLDISRLGVCLSNGNIHFQTEDVAISYIRHRLLDSLNRPIKQQFERGITKRGTRILAESNGDAWHSPFPYNDIEEVTKRMDKNAVRDVELWHSHPDKFGIGQTGPLSPQDIDTFENFHLKKVVALNSNGQINSIEVASDFSVDKFEKFKKFIEEFYNSELEKLLPKELQNKLAKLKKIFKEKKKLPSNLEKEGEEIEQAMMRLEEKGEGIKILHKCYQQAEQYGMKYHNKFTNL